MQKILKEWKKNQFKPFYWLEGEEPYFLDILSSYAEKHIIEEEAKIFDEDILFGSELSLGVLMMSCRRLPVYGDRRLILIKEAQAFKEVELFCKNFVPVDKVIVIVIYKGRCMEGKNKVKKRIEEIGVYYFAKKIYENQLPNWIIQYLDENNFKINPDALQLLIEAVGVELNRLDNELQKLILNLKPGTSIDADMVSHYVGISREYSLFELQNAFNRRNTKVLLKIMYYMTENPKNSPFSLFVVTLHAYFLKVLLCQELQTKQDRSELAKSIGVHPFFVQDYQVAAGNYTRQNLEESIQILTEYHLRHLGIANYKNPGDAALLKECFTKIMLSLEII